MTLGRLSRKLLITSAIFSLIGLGATVWLVLRDAARIRNEEVAVAVRLEAERLAARLERVLTSSEQVAEAIANAASADREVIVLDPRGALLASQAPSISSPALLHAHPAVQRIAQVGAVNLQPPPPPLASLELAVAPVGPRENPRALVFIGRPHWRLAADSAGALRAIVVVVLAAVAITAGLAVTVWRWWSRPLEGILGVARSLSRGDLSAALDVSGGNDEMSVLTRALSRMRERLVRNYETIDRQRRMLESLVSQLREGVIVADDAGRIALINPAAIRLLHLAPEISGAPPAGVAVERYIPQHDIQRLLLSGTRAQALADLERTHGDALLSEPPEPGVLRAHVEIDGPQGTTHLLVRASELALPPVEQADQRPLGRLLVMTDVTALTRMIQMKTDFVANASHELRTPLSTIRATVETLQQMDFATNEQAARRFIEMIDRHSARLQDLVSDLLDLARLESPLMRFELQSVAVRDLLDDLREHAAQRLEAKRLEWVADLAECRRATIVANPQLLRLVLDNLVDNAVKFTDEGGRITVRCRTTDDRAEFSVADTGCGIAPEEQERVFERFYQVERARSGVARGTGLGLSIVRHAVAAMDGDVHLASRLGQGTTVTVSIPQHAAAP